jgi:dUTP pyrophosphatase
MTKPDMPVKMAPGVPMPAYAHPDDAAFDLALHLDAPLTLQPGEISDYLPTGVAVAFPDGYFGLMAARSSLSKRGLAMANSVGIIDHGYRGEMRVKLRNISSEPQTLQSGERVVQLILLPYMQANLIPVETLPETQRGEGGLGSTGK